MDPDSRKLGIVSSSALPNVTRNGLSEERFKLSDRIISLYMPVFYHLNSKSTFLL